MSMSGASIKREKFLRCPYEPSHVVDPLRMAIHLIKCKKQYPHIEIIICPFNATHHIRKEKFQSHIEECKDKAIVDRALFIKSNPNLNPVCESLANSARPKEASVSTGEEVWDQEIANSVSYNPLKNVIYKEVSRLPPSGLGKSGRRKWRNVDCVRVQRLREGQPIEDLIYPTPDGGEVSIYEIVNGPGVKKQQYSCSQPNLVKAAAVAEKSRTSTVTEDLSSDEEENFPFKKPIEKANESTIPIDLKTRMKFSEERSATNVNKPIRKWSDLLKGNDISDEKSCRSTTVSSESVSCQEAASTSVGRCATFNSKHSGTAAKDKSRKALANFVIEGNEEKLFTRDRSSKIFSMLSKRIEEAKLSAAQNHNSSEFPSMLPGFRTMKLKEAVRKSSVFSETDEISYGGDKCIKSDSEKSIGSVKEEAAPSLESDKGKSSKIHRSEATRRMILRALALGK